MIYTKFVLNRAISGIINNPTLRSIVKTIFGVIYTILAVIFGIVFSRFGVMAIAGIIGIFMFSTLYGTISDNITSMGSISTNMSSASSTSVSSVYASTFNMLNETTGMLPILIFAIAGIFPLMFIMRLLGSDLRGGVM